jgi:adenylate cyclase
MMHAEALRLHGEFDRARHHCEQGLACFDPQRRLEHVHLYGNDTGIGCRNTYTEVLWELGYPDQAAEQAETVLALAHQLAHPFTLVFALHATAVLRQRRREAEIVQQQAETVIRLSNEHGFPLYLSLATVLSGWALAAQGETRAGIEQMEAGIAARQATGATTLLPDLLSMLAQAYGREGQMRRAFAQIDEAERLVAANKEYLMEAELLRLRGELLLAAGADAADAEVCLQRALDVARRQQARSWELRAATSMARLWQRQGRAADARAMLGAVYGWFSEGLDTADLIEAKELLETL